MIWKEAVVIHISEKVGFGGTSVVCTETRILSVFRQDYGVVSFFVSFITVTVMLSV